jgi:uncharacterized protein
VRPAGVGLVWWPALEPVFRAGACEVLELEPQALWEKIVVDGAQAYRLNESLLDQVLRLPQRKLVHGVGQPLAGTVDDPVPHMPLLRTMCDRLNAEWASEHLSFNRIVVGDEVRETGFLLPPAQTAASARVAAANIDWYRSQLARPIAFETGVNYLNVCEGDLDDGTFFASVARGAQCGILLDLHNVWCNERNGRRPVREVLAHLPLDAIWEVHLAGGTALDGWWLDAHSDLVPPPLYALAEEVLPLLPNVRALVFEILPDHLPAVGLNAVEREIERLKALWRGLPASNLEPLKFASLGLRRNPDDVGATAQRELALHHALSESLGGGEDRGLALYRELIAEFRRAHLAKAMRFSMTALLAGLGASETRALLCTYCRDTPADAYASVEAERFARFLAGRADVVSRVPYLDEVMAFESALIASTLRGEEREIEWSVDPTAVLEALDAGRLPGPLPPCRSVMRIAA